MERFLVDPLGVEPLANGEQLRWLNVLGVLALIPADCFPITATHAADLIREAIDSGLVDRFHAYATSK